MMRRRNFLALAGAAVVLPQVSFAQQQAKTPRIAFVCQKGFLDIPYYMAGLANFGYVDGGTAVITSFLYPTVDDGPAAVVEAVASKPDIILLSGVNCALAAKKATSTIPVVFGLVRDPVGQGVVANLAHPGGNLTGTSQLGDLVGKQLALTKEALPAAKRFVALLHYTGPNRALITPQIEAAAKALGLEAVIMDFFDDQDFTTQFDRVVAAAPQFVYVDGDPYFATKSDQLAVLQIKYRLPLITGASSGNGSYTVMGYGPNTGAIARRTGTYVDAILRGAKPGDLPVELPSVFDLVIRLSTAKAIAMNIPLSILAQATQVIE